MSEVQFFGELVASIWEGMSRIEVPVLHIPVTSLLIGAFVASFSIMILRPILGLGDAALGSLSLGVHKARSVASQKQQRSNEGFNARQRAAESGRRYAQSQTYRVQRRYHVK